MRMGKMLMAQEAAARQNVLVQRRGLRFAV